MTVALENDSTAVAQEEQQGDRGAPTESEPSMRAAATHLRQPRAGLAVPAQSSASDTSGQSQPVKGLRTASDMGEQRKEEQQQQVQMVWQGASLPARSQSTLANPRPSEQLTGEDVEDDSDDMQTEKRSQTKDRPRKPHLQGRFSGRLETKVCSALFGQHERMLCTRHCAGEPHVCVHHHQKA